MGFESLSPTCRAGGFYRLLPLLLLFSVHAHAAWDVVVCVVVCV